MRKFILCWLLFSLGVLLANEEIIVPSGGKVVSLVTIDEYPPFSFRLDNLRKAKKEREIIAPDEHASNLQGYSWDLVRASFHAVGYTIILRAMPWDLAVSFAQGGETLDDINSLSRKRGSDYRIHLNVGNDSYLVINDTSGIKSGKNYTQLLFPAEKSASTQNFVFSDEAVAQSKVAAYALKKSPLTNSAPANLTGANIGFLKGCDYGNLREQYADAKILDVDDATIGFNYLRSGRLNVLFGYDAVFDHDLRANKLEHLYKKIPTTTVIEEFLCGVKDAPNIAEILKDFSQGMKFITENGTYEKIQKKWKIGISEE